MFLFFFFELRSACDFIKKIEIQWKEAKCLFQNPHTLTLTNTNTYTTQNKTKKTTITSPSDPQISKSFSWPGQVTSTATLGALELQSAVLALSSELIWPDVVQSQLQFCLAAPIWPKFGRLPITNHICTATSKRAWAFLGTFTGSPSQGREASYFCCQSHLRPPQDFEIMFAKTCILQRILDTFPWHKTITSIGLPPTFPQESPSALINCLNHPFWQIQCNRLIYRYSSEDRLNHI
jgi:hypothetical protein